MTLHSASAPAPAPPYQHLALMPIGVGCSCCHELMRELGEAKRGLAEAKRRIAELELESQGVGLRKVVVPTRPPATERSAERSVVSHHADEFAPR